MDKYLPLDTVKSVRGQPTHNLLTTMFHWVQRNELADYFIITPFYWVDSTKLAAYLITLLKLSLPCILLNIHS